MTGTTFAALRRRVMEDAALRARLRAGFEHTLTEERLLQQLSTDQRDQLRLALMLHDALRMPDPRGRRRAPAPAQRASGVARAPQQQPPIDLGAWRARRAAGGH